MADWQAIKTEYITTDTSYRKLAQKYGVSTTQICNVGRDERWVELREQHLNKTVAKTLEKISDKQSDKLSRIDDLADKLLMKLEQAITELDRHIIVHKDKVETESGEKTTEYREAVAGGVVDRQGLKQIASALKDIKEVKMLRSELDWQEQEARIAALRQKAAGGDGDDDDTGVIFLPPRIGEGAENE